MGSDDSEAGGFVGVAVGTCGGSGVATGGAVGLSVAGDLDCSGFVVFFGVSFVFFGRFGFLVGFGVALTFGFLVGFGVAYFTESGSSTSTRGSDSFLAVSSFTASSTP